MYKNKTYFRRRIKGYSLIELLVVILIFSIISVIATQSITLSLRGTKKSDSVIEVKNNVEYAMSTMERLLRNAREVTCSGGSVVQYRDENNILTTLSCVDDASGTYLASGSANLKLTNPDTLTINNCTTVFTILNCPQIPQVTVPPVVEITVQASHRNNAILGAEGANYESKTRVLLRTY